MIRAAGFVDRARRGSGQVKKEVRRRREKNGSMGENMEEKWKEASTTKASMKSGRFSW